MLTEIDESMNTIVTEKMFTQINLKVYMESMYEALKKFNPWAQTKLVRESVYLFF